jgi:succinate dehydrogenase/fumarate reductase flavoprotein subunit
LVLCGSLLPLTTHSLLFAIGSLLDCVVFGRIAGRSAARFMLAENLKHAQSHASFTLADRGEVVEFDWGRKILTIRQSGEGAAPPRTAGEGPGVLASTKKAAEAKKEEAPKKVFMQDHKPSLSDARAYVALTNAPAALAHCRRCSSAQQEG